MAIGMAITAAGTYAQASAAKKSENAILQAREQERQRQKAYQNQSAALFDQSLSNQGVAKTESAMKKDVEQRVAQGEANVAAAPSNAPIASVGGTPKVVADESAVRGAAAGSSASVENANRALAAGFGGAQIGTSLMNLDFARRQGLIDSNMRGSLVANQAELEAAKNAGSGLATAGKIGTGIGSMLNMYGAMQTNTKPGYGFTDTWWTNKG